MKLEQLMNLIDLLLDGRNNFQMDSGDYIRILSKIREVVGDMGIYAQRMGKMLEDIDGIFVLKKGLNDSQEDMLRQNLELLKDWKAWQEERLLPP